MKTINVPIPKYPWPYLVGPFVESFTQDEIDWYDTDFTFMSEATREKYKKHGLAQATSYMFPGADTIEKIRPICRFMIWLTLYDDYYELCPVDELAVIRDRIMEVMLGASLKPDDIGLIRQVAYCRDEFRPYANNEWFDRWTQAFYRYTTYGLMEETPYKLSGKMPTLNNLLLIREYSISMYTFGEPVELTIDFIMPGYIAEHPAIQRIKMLMCRIIAIQNDLASLQKELAVETEILNIVLVIQHQYKISLEEACVETIRIHDEYVKELQDMEANLPDFGIYQKDVEKYIYYMILMITGLGAWYYKGTSSRYTVPGAFPKPEYGIASSNVPE